MLNANVVDLLSSKIDRFHQLNHEIKSLESIKTQLSNQIKNEMGERGLIDYFTDNHHAKLSSSSRSVLKIDLLKELGLTDEDLELCSVQTNYSVLSVR